MTHQLVERLTQRERDCLRLVDRHLSSKQIARELGMSKTSVDTYCDRARRKLGAGDRYEAARQLADHDRLVLIGSGQDTVRTDTRPVQELHDTEHGDFQYGHVGEAVPGSETPGGKQQHLKPLRGRRAQDGASRDAPAQGDRSLREPVALAGRARDAATELQLGSARASTRGSDGFADQGRHGARSSVSHPQDGSFQAAGNGFARSTLFDLGIVGREFPAGVGGSHGDSGYNLGPLAKLGWIGLIAISSALAFGALLAGLHALKDLA